MYTFTTAAGWKEEALLQTEALRLEVLFFYTFHTTQNGNANEHTITPHTNEEQALQRQEKTSNQSYLRVNRNGDTDAQEAQNSIR